MPMSSAELISREEVYMPQMLLPFFPAGVTHITPELAFRNEDGVVIYFNAHMPVFRHSADDIQSFKFIIAQFYVLGVVKQAEITRAFGVNSLLVKRAVKQYREQGIKAFSKDPNTRGAGVLTPDVLRQAQELLDRYLTPAEISKRLTLKADTIRKAIAQGRLHRPSANSRNRETEVASSKSERSAEDSDASMGVATTNVVGRLAASIGLSREGVVAPRFSPMLDVPCGGVLLALPALLAIGLLRRRDKHFSLPPGYYGLTSIFLLLGFLALARVKSLEKLRYEPPGEWGKLLGLDRVPEVRTLREKVSILADSGDPVPWSAELCKDWMEEAPLQAQVCYVDGHVRVYHGEQTNLPRHFVARQRLCLRATVDYWVNAMDGQPFFVVHQDVDPGLVQVVERDILPFLERAIPGQPNTDELASNPLLHRFTIVFDREGYSPDLMFRFRQIRVACLTYRKRPGDDWPIEEFSNHEVRLVCGEIVTMRLAERGTFLGGKLWVREFRRLTDSGHQTSIVATDYIGEMTALASAMFARWSQENFFAYMRIHYGLDQLITYGTEKIPDTVKVVNPEHRSLEGEIRKKASLLTRVAAKFANLGLEGEITPGQVEAYENKKAALQDEVGGLRAEVDSLKKKRKEVAKHITFGELPEDARFERLAVSSKHMIDTIKMIAYRSETSMAHILRDKMSRQDDARALLQSIYTTEVDLIPDYNANILTVRLHNMSSRTHEEAVIHLCNELSETETVYPGTDLRIIYELVSSQNLRDQEI